MKIPIRPLTQEEELYVYTQSRQLDGQTGCVGHLRGDMDTNGKSFYTTWTDHLVSLKTEEFKTEFDNVVNALRFDPECSGILHDRDALSRCCAAHPASRTKQVQPLFGFRADTERFSYLLRLNPRKGEYNFYIYCYRRDLLDRHLEAARAGIRFITPQYKELFRLQDGDQIHIITGGGSTRTRFCRYIDDTHFETSGTYASALYHICEFAERLERTGAAVIPLRRCLPEECLSVLPSSGEIIVLRKGENGYAPSPDHPGGTAANNRTFVDRQNELNGVTKAQEAAMLAGSMFGWQAPAADPRNYNEQGLPIRPRRRERNDVR